VNARPIGVLLVLAAIGVVIAGSWNLPTQSVCNAINAQDAQLGSPPTCSASVPAGYWVAAAVLVAVAILLFAVSTSIRVTIRNDDRNRQQ
jgi:TRAP-type C4-dicarboxylate transport system permease small subunit